MHNPSTTVGYSVAPYSRASQCLNYHATKLTTVQICLFDARKRELSNEPILDSVGAVVIEIHDAQVV